MVPTHKKPFIHYVGVLNIPKASDSVLTGHLVHIELNAGNYDTLPGEGAVLLYQPISLLDNEFPIDFGRGLGIE